MLPALRHGNTCPADGTPTAETPSAAHGGPSAPHPAWPWSPAGMGGGKESILGRFKLQAHVPFSHSLIKHKLKNIIIKNFKTDSRATD